MKMDEWKRCAWARGEKMARYHDQEWCVPEHRDGKLFEMLLLEGFQAGLSWSTVLNKREAFRRALDGFDARRIASYGQEKLDELMQDAAIIRSGRKLRAAVDNARVFLSIAEEFGSFDRYLWGFTGGRVVRLDASPMPASSALSERVSKDLKRRGMRFVGPVIVYSFLQSVGMVDDHDADCFRRRPNVLLIGPMGVDKGAVAAALARLTNRRLVDLEEDCRRLEQNFAPNQARMHSVLCILGDVRGAVMTLAPEQGAYPDPVWQADFGERMRGGTRAFLLLPQGPKEALSALAPRDAWTGRTILTQGKSPAAVAEEIAALL